MARRKPRAHRIVITGATDGIGFLLARSYAARGHKVLATGRRMLVNHSAHFGHENIRYIRADQSDPARAARSFAGALDSMGWESVDLAILNAGIGWQGAAEDEEPASIDAQIDVNLTGTILTAHALCPYLVKEQGRLVIVGSSLAKGGAHFATYAATKGALCGFAKSLREEWRGRAHITVVHPGPTKTNMHAKAGMELGFVRRFFMRADRAVAGIERAVREGAKERNLGRFYALRASWHKPREGQL